MTGEASTRGKEAAIQAALFSLEYLNQIPLAFFEILMWRAYFNCPVKLAKS